MESLTQRAKKWFGFSAKMSVQPSIEVIKETESTRTVPVKLDGQEYKIQIQAAMLDLYFSSGKFGQAELMLLYDPMSGLFGWDFTQLRDLDGKFSADSKEMVLVHRRKLMSDDLAYIESTLDIFLDISYIYLSKTQLIFLSLPDRNIWFREFSERSATLGEARQQVLAFLEKQLDKIEKITVDWRREIGLWGNIMDSHFFHEQKKWGRGNHPSPFGEKLVARITDMNFHEGQWQILMGSTNNRRTTLILDEDFQLLEVKGDGALKK